MGGLPPKTLLGSHLISTLVLVLRIFLQHVYPASACLTCEPPFSTGSVMLVPSFRLTLLSLLHVQMAPMRFHRSVFFLASLKLLISTRLPRRCGHLLSS